MDDRKSAEKTRWLAGMDSGQQIELVEQDKKRCKECGYLGKMNEVQNCGSCKMEGKKNISRKVCTYIVSQNDEGLQCDGSQGWYHREYEEVKKSLYLELGKIVGMCWHCSDCKTEIKTNHEDAKKLKEMNEELI
ncbi:hypothetical protein SK128_017986 [Halocaridina rubra]|uniref:Uncharacterized protein n=1 Tax=Halocaridina rubra TaxID=373956 RepID=A0AAN8XRU0_HALRR